MSDQTKRPPYMRALAACVMSCFVASGAVSAQRVQTSSLTTITGTVQFFGCFPDPALLVIEAVPFTLQISSSPDARAMPMKAQFLPTANPRLLNFIIQGLAPARPYRLAAAYPDEACGRVFWRALESGIVPAGTADVAIEGYAARTGIQVLSQADGEWTGADDLRLTEISLGTREFRWRTTIPGVTGGQLQISTDAFPTDGVVDPCAETQRGVILRVPVPAPTADELGRCRRARHSPAARTRRERRSTHSRRSRCAHLPAGHSRHWCGTRV